MDHSDTWVIISTTRIEEPYQRALEVFKTDANLAIVVNGAKESHDNLIPLRNKYPDRFVLVYGQFKELVESANYIYGSIRFWNPSKNNFIVTIPDDMELKDGWLNAFLECLADQGTALIVGNDGRSNCNLAGFAGITDKFIDIYQKGWLLCPEYLHWFLDWEMYAIAKSTGTYRICKNAKAYHLMTDHSKNMTKKGYQLDEETWIRRQKTKFPYENIPEAPWRYWIA